MKIRNGLEWGSKPKFIGGVDMYNRRNTLGALFIDVLVEGGMSRMPSIVHIALSPISLYEP